MKQKTTFAEQIQEKAKGLANTISEYLALLVVYAPLSPPRDESSKLIDLKIKRLFMHLGLIIRLLSDTNPIPMYGYLHFDNTTGAIITDENGSLLWSIPIGDKVCCYVSYRGQWHFEKLRYDTDANEYYLSFTGNKRFTLTEGMLAAVWEVI